MSYRNSRTSRSAVEKNNLNRKQALRRRRTSRKKSGAGRSAAGKAAQNRLRQFRKASLVAVAVTGFLILILSPGEAGYQSQPSEAAAASVDTSATEEPISGEEIREATKDEALITLNNLWVGLYANLPKIIVALAALLIAWALSRLVRYVLRKTIAGWKSSGAIIALTSIAIWLIAVGVAASAIAGDIRALIGSLGLVGLALSWALQTPIESFTGWLLNSFQRYYKTGDRIQVGEIFGDVYKIDFLTTTVWEIGAPHRQGFVMAEQPTGRLVTFPNNEILSGSVVNLTGDFPYVWDELNIAVANESDIRYAMRVAESTASAFLEPHMKEPARLYQRILERAGIGDEVSGKPEVYVGVSDSWTDIIVRYIVNATERRKWKSELTIRMTEEFARKEHADKIKPAYPRRQVQWLDEEGSAAQPGLPAQ